LVRRRPAGYTLPDEEKAMSVANEPLVLHEADGGGILTLTLNRPQAYNALSRPLMAALSDALADAADDGGVRVVVIAGAGKGFSAGHDLREVRGLRDDGERRALLQQCSAMMQAIVAHPKPVIAQVHGTATAAGCQLVATCDLAVAAADARFATPGVNIGLFCHTPLVAVGRAVGRKQAMEMALTGELIDAETALRFGLINRAVPAAELRAATLALAATIAGKSAHVLRLGKQALYRQLEMPLAEAYDYAGEVMLENLLARDAEEGIGAFVEKRQPQWQDR
jgi:enoyl-CoA hydratase/carnithine racemase